MRWSWIVVVALALGCGGNKSGGKEMVPIEATAVLAGNETLEWIEVTIHTLPSASVSVIAGSGIPVSGTADAKGDVMVRVNLRPSDPPELVVTVKANQSGPKPEYVPGSKDLKVTKTPRLTINTDGTGFCTMKTCTVALTEAGHVEVTQFADVSTITIDGAKATIANRKADHAIDILAVAEKVPLAEMFKRRDPYAGGSAGNIAVDIVWADGTKLGGTLPLPWATARRALAMRFASGPVKASTPGTGTGVLEVNPDAISAGVTKLGDIGFVVAYGEARREQECGTYRNDEGKQARFFMYLIDLTVRITEASTGKVLGEKTFLTPKAPCPRYVAGAMPEARYERGGADKVWIDALTKPR